MSQPFQPYTPPPEAGGAGRVVVRRGVDGYEHAGDVRNLVLQVLNGLRLPPDLIRPGDHVVLKPNWIKEWDERYPEPGHWEHVVTHPLVIETVAGWVADQLGGDGSITVCDAPQTDSSFDRIRSFCGLDDMVARLSSAYPGVRFRLLDLRPEEWHAVDGVTVSRRTLPGDPDGFVDVGLHDDSEFVDFGGLGQLYGASYDMDETNRRHAGRHHEYRLCRTPMAADVLINLPKLKTHKKVGLTCALKNLVGINGDKNWLPHHTEGTPSQGGDQFPADDLRSRTENRWMGKAKRLVNRIPFAAWLLVPAKKVARLVFGSTHDVIRSGNWYGNDTCWRMVHDLNKCLFGFDGNAVPRKEPLRYLAIVDGIVGGEGNGPMAPDPRPCGVILAGTHPVAVDAVAATLMGFDVARLPVIARAFREDRSALAPFPLSSVTVDTGEAGGPVTLDAMRDIFDFKPHFGWAGHIERAGRRHES